MEKTTVEMLKLQDKMVLESLDTIIDMIDGNRHFVIDNRNMIGGRQENRWLWDDYYDGYNALSRALSDVRYAKEQLMRAERMLKGDE